MPEQQIKIMISERDRALIRAACKKASGDEVGGLGTIMYTERGTPYVSNLYIPPQTVSRSQVDWGDIGLTSYLEWLYKPVSEGGAGYDNDDLFLYSFHSHNYMDVFWSKTDEEFVEIIRDSGAKYLVSSVFNNKGEAKHRLDVFYSVTGECPLVDIDQRSQITYEDDGEVVLSVFSPKVIRDKLDSISDLEDKREEEIEKINEKYEKEIKALEDQVDEDRATIQESVTEEMEEYWSDRVTSSRKNWYSRQFDGHEYYGELGGVIVNSHRQAVAERESRAKERSAKVNSRNHEPIYYVSEDHVKESLSDMVLVDNASKNVSYFTTIRHFLDNTDTLDLNGDFDYGVLEEIALGILNEIKPIEDEIAEQMIGWEGHV